MPSSSETFDTFFTNVPAATTPLTTEPMLVLQGGTTKQVPVGGGVGNATVFYVSPTGNDAAAGTSQAKAWQTIAKVNASTFLPGTVVLFQGGQTFSGAIVCPSSGTPGAPIIFGSYGGGQATISSGTSNGFTSTNQAGIIVRDLTFSGSASSNHGVLFQNTLGSNVHLQNIQAINLNVSGYGIMGVFVLGNNGSAGFDDVMIQGCNVTSCCSVAFSGQGTAGIAVMSIPGQGLATFSPSFFNVIVDNCSVSSCPGATDIFQTGSGIYLGEVQQGVIRNCVATGNGASAVSTHGTGGPVGIWTCDSIGVSISNCRVTGQLTADGADGFGFDLDAGCVDCEIRDCFSSGNYGGSYEVNSFHHAINTPAITYTTFDKCRLINCVSDKDVVGASPSGTPASIAVVNSFTMTNFDIVGCTVYLEASHNIIVYEGSAASSITGRLLDNVFSVNGTQTIVSGSIPAGVTQANKNVIYTGAQSPLIFGLNGGSYNIISLNNSLSSTGTIGLVGGATGDNNLYVNVPTGGTHFLQVNGNNAIGVSGSVPSALRVFNTTSGNEYGVFDWTTSTNVLTIGTEKTGGGSTRNLQFVIGNTNQLDFGISVANTWTFNSSNGIYVPYITQTGVSGYGGGLFIRISTDTAVGNRIQFDLDGSDNPILRFGPGGNTAPETGISRTGAQAFAFGNGTQGDVSATLEGKGFIASGDPGGTASTNTVSGTNSTTIGAGTGTVKMSSANNANNTGWLKCYIGTQVAWIPCWTTNAP